MVLNDRRKIKSVSIGKGIFAKLIISSEKIFCGWVLKQQMTGVDV
jgi:hypothetical protein